MDELELGLIEVITCTRCGQQKPAGKTPGWCVDCERAYNNRYSYFRQQNSNWLEVAKENGIDVWERQPGETQLEWTIWQAYRDSYPGAKPSYKKVAEKAGTTYDYVVKVASRWSFNTRMQAWIAECDRVTLAQRRQEVLDMNRDHINMAVKLREKMNAAIDFIDPATLKPSELNSLLKTMTELEKKARMDTMDVESQLSDGFVDHENPNLKKSPTKQGDLSEVVSILLKAGALGDITQIGVRQTETKTTEVVMRDNDGNELSSES